MPEYKAALIEWLRKHDIFFHPEFHATDAAAVIAAAEAHSPRRSSLFSGQPDVSKRCLVNHERLASGVSAHSKVRELVAHYVHAQR
jgi:hypothetical protein